MFRRAARAAAVTGLALLPLLGAVPGQAAEWRAPAATAAPSPSGGPHLEFDWDKVEVGGRVGVGITGMPPDWDVVTVTCPALKKPIRLTPERQGASQSRQFPDSKGEDVRSDIAPGTYPATATSDGRTVATAQLTVTPEAPASISRFVAGPKGGILGSGDSTPEVTVRPGGEIVVLLADGNPARKEDSLTVKSKAFEGPLTIRTESEDDPGCKCDDGSTVYAGHTTLRDDIPAGTYSLTVVSHHGKKTSSAQLVVSGEPVTHYRAWLIGGAVILALAGAGGFVMRRRRRLKSAGQA
ncbi:hypothetical protein HRW07_06085 [Streptomyces lunaelactis]|uniref:hypothetical protein n=1 Tax=Streptomyces lunaelactis TaxID=1535768 RepID=UPI001585CA03|nr:hypothetical protein [Streptomyces lunaelactis]NUL02825.1 hypothetical protein [Streptomyces lunaelactis]